MDKILIINPGSTSTKIAMYSREGQLWQENIEHDPAQIAAYATVYAQLDMRLGLLLDTVAAKGDRLDELVAVMARGGLLPPVSSGAYEVNEAMLDVLEHRPVNHHASNLGAALAYRVAGMAGVKAYIYDPVTVDELTELARITGLREIRRHGQAHNLNMRAAALRHCREHGLDYAKSNLVVAHLGGGITFTLHSGGRIVDMVSDDEGSFSPERAGGLPLFQYTRLLLERQLDYPAAMKLLQRGGGLQSHLGTTDVRRVEAMANGGDTQAALVLEAMALGVAQAIARLSVAVDGAVDAIVLTGGIAHSAHITGMVEKRVRFIAPVRVLAGENEMQALWEGAMRVLNGEEQARVYAPAAPRPDCPVP